jgi:hypothetical protein
MNVRAWISLAACGAGLLLSGCGGEAAPNKTLAGNWLIVGPMPTNNLEIGQIPTFRMAMTFDVTGSDVTASGFANEPCNSLDSSSPLLASSVFFGSLAIGTVSPDGSFSVQPPTGNALASMSVQGKIPQTSGGDWSGTYTVSLGSQPIGSPCSGIFTGAFTATSFPLVSGTYLGAGSAPTIRGATGKTVAVQITVQQGGMVIDPTTGVSKPSSSVLTGSILVGGTSCFSSGKTMATPSSSVAGSMVNAFFTMDDGSTLSMEGALTDSTEQTITPGLFVVTGGKCAGFYQLPELDRQN